MEKQCFDFILGKILGKNLSNSEEGCLPLNLLKVRSVGLIDKSVNITCSFSQSAYDQTGHSFRERSVWPGAVLCSIELTCFSSRQARWSLQRRNTFILSLQSCVTTVIS